MMLMITHFNNAKTIIKFIIINIIAQTKLIKLSIQLKYMYYFDNKFAKFQNIVDNVQLL